MLLTWNLANASTSDWATERGKVAAVLAAERPTLLCVQEAQPHQLEDLARLLPRHALVRGPAETQGARNAVFVDRTLYEVLDTGGAWLSDTPHKPSASWGNKVARAATWLRLRERATGREMELVNTHLDHESEPSRRRSARFLQERFPDAVLAGDFNAEPRNDVHDILTDTRRDPHPARGMETMHGNEGAADARYDWILVPADMPTANPRRVDWHAVEEAPSDHAALAVDLGDDTSTALR